MTGIEATLRFGDGLAQLDHLEAELRSPPTIRVPELEDDVHDIDGLAQVRAHLFAD